MSDEVSSAPGALPTPQRTLRTVTLAVMAATLIAALALLVSLRGDVVYALQDHDAVELGPFDTADAAAHAGAYARVTVALEAPAAQFRRPLEPSTYRVARAGADRWVVYAMPDGHNEQRFPPPKLVAGRLTRASDLGARFQGVSALTGADAWVLVDGDDPHGVTWILGLAVMLAGFMLFNVGGTASLLRRVR